MSKLKKILLFTLVLMLMFSNLVISPNNVSANAIGAANDAGGRGIAWLK